MTLPLMTLDAWRARGRMVTVYGHPLFLVEAGAADAPPLLLLHGYPTSSHDYSGVIDMLATQYRVVAHDHLGFGQSSKPAEHSYSLVDQAELALGLWHTLGITTGHLVAHDYGTSVATELMARRERGGLPVRLATLTLCNGSVHLELARPRLIQKLLRHPITGPWVARLSSKQVFARNMRGIVARPESLPSHVLDDMWTLLTLKGGKDRLPALTRYLDERRQFWHRWIGALTRLNLPAHVLWGARDPVARPQVAEKLAGEIPGATLTWLSELGHYPMVEDGRAWATALTVFIAQHPL